jgi:hypothetical protein
MPQHHPGSGGQASMHATGQHQHASEVARRVRQLYPGLERPACTFERKTFRLGLGLAGIDLGRSGRGVDAALAQDPAKRGRNIEVGRAPDMDHDGKPSPGMAVEDIEQPLVGVPLHGALGGDPVRAAGPARI